MKAGGAVPGEGVLRAVLLDRSDAFYEARTRDCERA
jgi:hypothetical protein